MTTPGVCLKSLDCFYFWSQPVAKDAGVSFYRPHDPKTIRLCKDVYLIIYRGTLKQELLYRLKFEKRFALNTGRLNPSPIVFFGPLEKRVGLPIISSITTATEI
jgi:hypothetical protein